RHYQVGHQTAARVQAQSIWSRRPDAPARGPSSRPTRVASRMRRVYLVQKTGYASRKAVNPAPLFGNVVVVSPSFLNGEAAISTPLRVPAAPSTLVDPGLVGSAVPQGQTNSAVRAIGQPDTAGKAIDQLFANFREPLTTVLSGADDERTEAQTG